MIRSSIAALLLLATSLGAQITLDAAALRLPIGTSLTMESFIVQGTMEDAGITLGPAGPDQTFDFSGPFEGNSIFLSVAIIPLRQSPNGTAYPEADYAARYDIENPDGSMVEMYAYLQRTEQGDAILAVEGGPSVPIVTADSTIPLPMEFGSRWDGIESTVQNEIAPGVQLLGTMVQGGEIDGWGTISVPAGDFACLRLRSTSSGVLRYEGDENLEALGDLISTTVGYSWNTHYLGTVASVAQSTTEASNGSLPTSVLTQVIRVVEASGLPSVVAEIGWAQLKKMQVRP